MDETIVATPEVEDGLIGIDPDDTTVISYGKGQFTVGVMPVGLWDVLNTEWVALQQGARRRAIAKLAAAAEDPDEIVYADLGLTRLDVEIPTSPEYRAEMSKIMIKAVRYGLRGFTKFGNKDGKPFEFKVQSEILEGELLTVVANPTLRVMRANFGLLQALWSGFRSLNEMGAQAKKA